MTTRSYMAVIAIVLALGAMAQAGVKPLAAAHAHNDYRHERPLLDALDHGFTSVEADVFLVGDKLCVAHDREEIRPDRTLRALYLDPLRARAEKYKGHIYSHPVRFHLLIDFKSAAEPTYRRLHEILAGYDDVVTSFGPEGRVDRAILINISGNRPLELMKAQKLRYAGYDGRLSDLHSELPAELMPLVSDHWGRNFTWRGAGPMPEEERKKLRGIVQAAHEKGRLVRFWATPDRRSPERVALWSELHAAGVDLINTDDLVGLQAFLLKHER